MTEPVPIKPEDFAALQESVKKLEANNKALLAEKAEAAKKAKEAEEAAARAAEEAAKKSGDVAALEKSWQEKLDKELKTKDDALTKYQQSIKDLTAGSTAKTLASELALPGHAEGLLPHITGRLSVEFGEDGPIMRVLDKSGKPSAMSVDDLKAEIKATPYLASMLLGSQANGAGKPGAAGKTGKATMKRSEWQQLDAVEKAKAAKECQITD